MRPEEEPPDRPPPPEETIDLARRIQEGSGCTDDSWTAIADKVETYLGKTFAEASLPHGYTSADLRQDVFLRLLKGLPTMQVLDRNRFWAYVHKLADNATIDTGRRFRALKRGQGQPPQAQQPAGASGPDHDVLDEVADNRVSTASGHARVQEIEQFELECVSELSERARDVYLRRRRDNETYESIAAAFSISTVSLRTIYMRGQRAVTRCLKSKLDGYFDGLSSAP